MAGAGAPAMAADFYEPPVVEAPPPVYYQPEPEPAYGGWYIRGDVDYHFSTFRGASYITYGPPAGTGTFDFGNFRGAFSGGAGVGYKVNKYFRTDFTADYLFRAGFTGQTSGTCGGVPCVSVDESGYSAWLLMANAYAELGTWKKITPYIGAGIGGAHVRWDDLRNTAGGTTTIHAGASSWRFAWALMAGASYCINKNWKFDLGYRFARISGGRMFEFGPAGSPTGAGPGFDAGMNIHEGRAGLRYQFGGDPACGPKEHYVSYEPEPIVPVYK